MYYQLFVYLFSCLFTFSTVCLHYQLFVYIVSCLFPFSTVCLRYQLFVYIVSCLFTHSAVCFHFQLFVYIISCLFILSAVCLYYQLFVYIFSWLFTLSAVLFCNDFSYVSSSPASNRIMPWGNGSLFSKACRSWRINSCNIILSPILGDDEAAIDDIKIWNHWKSVLQYFLFHSLAHYSTAYVHREIPTPFFFSPKNFWFLGQSHRFTSIPAIL